MVRSDLVANQKPTAVRVYDYYEPGQGRDVDTDLHDTVKQSLIKLKFTYVTCTTCVLPIAMHYYYTRFWFSDPDFWFNAIVYAHKV